MRETTEIWKPIKGFKHYSISNLGRVKNPFGKIMKPQTNYKGYLVLKLHPYGGGKASQMSVHRAVAMSFIDNPNNFPQVNHKDYNKKNNCVTNLEWCNSEYNQRYSHALTTYQYDLKGNFIQKWDAIVDAATALNIPTTSISKCCKGVLSTTNNYIFLYNKEIENRLAAVQNKYKCKCKSVSSYDLNGKFLKRFSSVTEAASYYKASLKSVILCCKGIKMSNNKIIFKYE